MFSQASVCPQGEMSVPLHAGIHPQDQRQTPPKDQKQTPPQDQRQTPPGRHPPADIPGRHPQGSNPPGPEADTSPWVNTGVDTPQCMLGYGQQAGSSHPTVLHSCYRMNKCERNSIKQMLINRGEHRPHFICIN